MVALICILVMFCLYIVWNSTISVVGIPSTHKPSTAAFPPLFTTILVKEKDRSHSRFEIHWRKRPLGWPQKSLCIFKVTNRYIFLASMQKADRHLGLLGYIPF